MIVEDALGNEMKMYEEGSDRKVIEGIPLVVRLDGKSFHNLTRNWFSFPFDEKFKECMYHAMKLVAMTFSNARIGYSQSDEISILFLTREGATKLYDNRIQKICSVLASTCAVAFYMKALEMVEGKEGKPFPIVSFDARCISLPMDVVFRYFSWRQRDAIKNAINSVLYWRLRKEGRKSEESNDIMNKMNDKEKISFLSSHFGTRMEDVPVHHVRGACVTRIARNTPIEEAIDPGKFADLSSKGKISGKEIVTRWSWVIDKSLPVFSDDESYLKRII